MYEKTAMPHYDMPAESIPVMSIGRLGKLRKWKGRPADAAILSMIDSAKSNIRMSLQDLGPIAVPGTKMPLPGLKWPKEYLQGLARAIWSRNVKVYMVLSNPGSTPGGDFFAQYGT